MKGEFEKLRQIVLDCELNEDFKWKHPCYTFENKNIVLIHGFKEYCALLFHKGALLKDPNGILIQQTENVQAARQIRLYFKTGFFHFNRFIDVSFQDGFHFSYFLYIGESNLPRGLYILRLLDKNLTSMKRLKWKKPVLK